MRLISVYEGDPYYSAGVLFDLLEEREDSVNISHHAMPTWEEHFAFVNSQPYIAWYLIESDGAHVGAIYLSKAREIGMFIFKSQRGRGYGKQAVAMLRELHPGKMLANVSLLNAKGLAFWLNQGFVFKQITLEAPDA